MSGLGTPDDPLKLSSPAPQPTPYATRKNAGDVVVQHNVHLPDLEQKTYLPRNSENASEEEQTLLRVIHPYGSSDRPAHGGGSSRHRPGESPTIRGAATTLVGLTTALPSDLLKVTRRKARAMDGSKVKDTNIKLPFRYMFSRLEDRAEALEDRLDEMEHALSKRHKTHLQELKENKQVIFGRICCDAEEGKLNSASIVLQLPDYAGQNQHVKLAVQRVESYVLFPGQIVGAVGTRTGPESFDVDSFLSSAPLPMFHSPRKLVVDEISAHQRAAADAVPSRGNGPLRVWTASGPFTLQGSLTFEPLKDLLREANQAKRDSRPMIDVLILVRALPETIRLGIFLCL